MTEFLYDRKDGVNLVYAKELSIGAMSTAFLSGTYGRNSPDKIICGEALMRQLDRLFRLSVHPVTELPPYPTVLEFYGVRVEEVPLEDERVDFFYKGQLVSRLIIGQSPASGESL